VVILEPYEGLRVKRGERVLAAELAAPHAVLSTCRVNGGLREDLSLVVNHQACEPRPHPDCEHRRCLAARDPEGYHRLICDTYGFPPEKTALLGTAANMYLAGFATEAFRDLTVFCAATAGVETNAGRAGDPAHFYEEEGRFLRIEGGGAVACDRRGTIVLMVFVNRPLTPGALVRAVKMVTEAKVTVLEELHVASRYSSGLATGTGTDQIAVAARLDPSLRPLSGAGKHVKLGELLSRATRRALFRALSLQNKLTPETVRYAPRLLERYGLGEETLLVALREFLPPPVHEWFARNRYPLLGDAVLVSHLLSYLHLWDNARWGIVPEEVASEVLLDEAALLAAALSQRRESFPEFRKKLAPETGKPQRLLLSALALGFYEKWHHEVGEKAGVVPESSGS